ncbi:antibiotic biosynthesis monooxygenase [Streptomyces sp. SudanB66_2053]|uniref:antibiotic biosynthesis monooxygenase n=1 Tax=Streptomyces sp. SudanB66_2053 TaxID=3035277 RepID=UPI003F577649
MRFAANWQRGAPAHLMIKEVAVTDQPMNAPSLICWDGSDVLLLAARIVEPGYEEAFQKWARGILAAASASPGHLGGGIFHPATDDGPWIIVHRFRDQAALDQWLISPARTAFLDDTAAHHHTEIARREVNSIEAWFTSLGTDSPAPPRWKMAAAACLGSYPISLLANGLLGPQLASVTPVVRAAIFALLFSTLMTFVLMPLVSRLLRHWLRPSRRGVSSASFSLQRRSEH